jgi:hypothetical protein
VGDWLAGAAGIPGAGLAFAALLASSAASAAPALGFPGAFAGAAAISSGALFPMFFAATGAAAGSAPARAAAGRASGLAAFVAIQLAVAWLVTVGGGWVAGLPAPAVLTAANAAVGGPGTAAATAAGRGWPELVQPAILVGALGYTIRTPLGLAVAAAAVRWGVA